MVSRAFAYVTRDDGRFARGDAAGEDKEGTHTHTQGERDDDTIDKISRIKTRTSGVCIGLSIKTYIVYETRASIRRLLFLYTQCLFIQFRRPDSIVDQSRNHNASLLHESRTLKITN